MSALTPFRVSGPTIGITCSVTAAPASVQCLNTEPVGNQQYVLSNFGANSAFVAIGTNAQQAQQNSGNPSTTNPTTTQNPTVYPLLNGSQVTITGPQNAWFTGTCVTGATAVYITPGYGQ